MEKTNAFKDSRKKAKETIVKIADQKLEREISSMFKVRTTAWG
jgi:hypothetical protein